MGAFRMKQVLVKYRQPVPVKCKACGKAWGPGHVCQQVKPQVVAQ